MKYLAIKAHFNGPFNYFKYKGKFKVSDAAYQKHKDKFRFEKLAKQLKDFDTIEKFMVANFLVTEAWVGDLQEEYYTQFKARYESLTYKFKQQLESIRDNLLKSLLVKDQYPDLLKYYFHSRISLETLIILDHYFKFVEKWNQQINEEYIWPKTYLKITKYTPFVLSYTSKEQLKKCKSIIQEKIKIDF